MSSYKKKLDYNSASLIAEEFLEKTRDLYWRAEIAGSLRRKESFVHDIDFAVMPNTPDFSAWSDSVRKSVSDIGGVVISLGDVICNLRFKNVQINLFVSTNEDTWGVVLMWATGPKGHTIGLTIKARDKGLNYSSKGIFVRDHPGELVPARTEMDVARILGWKYKPPESRGKKEKSGNEQLFY